MIVGGLEALDLIAQRLSLTGWFWRLVGALNDHFGAVGCAITAALAGCCILSVLQDRARIAA